MKLITEAKSLLARLATTLGIVFAVALTVGVGVYLVSTANPPTGGKTLLRWVVDPNPVRKVQIAGFEARHPNIKVMDDPDPSMQRLMTQLAGGVPPDVMTVYDVESARYFAKNGNLVDLRPYEAKYHIPADKIYKPLRPFMYYHGQLIGVPENCGAYVLIYNRKLFREAGVAYPKSGLTWDQCLEIAKKLTKYKNVNGRQVPVQKGLYVGGGDWWLFIWMHHGQMFSKDGKRCLMDSEAVKKGIRFWADLRLKYHVLPTSSEAASMAATGAWGGDNLLFRESKVAMIVSGRWNCIPYREQRDLDWDIVTAPHGPNRVTMLQSHLYVIPKTCPHKEAALEFISNALQKRNQLIVANYGDGGPTVDDPGITKAFRYNPRYPNERNNQLYIDELKYARLAEYSPYVSSSDTSQIMGVEFDRMWLGLQSPDETCDSIARQINAMIRRNLANPNFLN